MDDESNPYLDTSEDSWLLNEFDPEQTSNFELQIWGTSICKHLRVRNPLSGIKGLLALGIVSSSANKEQITTILAHIRNLLAVVAVLIAYIAYRQV